MVNSVLMATWLDNIDILEISPVKNPANRKPKLLQKSEEEKMSLWIEDNAAMEFIAKAKMNDEQKAAIKAAIGELNKARSGMSDEDFKGAHAMLAKLMGFGEEKKSDPEPKPEPKPEPAPAPEKLAKSVEALSPELKAEFVLLQKSREDDRKALVELQKSVEIEREANAKKEMISKAALEFKSIPMESSKLGEMLYAVQKSDKAAGETLLTLLKGTNEAMAKSALFTDLGSSGESARDKDGVTGKIEAQAKELMAKSATPLTKEQAFSRVLENNPSLYTDYLKSVG